MKEKTTGFKEHGLMIYLDKDLYRAFIKLQADKDLGRAYAGLLSLTEGFFALGYISEKDYKEHIKKYGKPKAIANSPLST